MLCLVAVPTGAHAQTTATMPVTFTLTQACSLTMGSNMAFGAFDVETLQTTGQNGQATVIVNCTDGVGWFLSADSGTHSTSLGNRRMRSGVTTGNAYFLPYQLHSAASRASGTEYPLATGTPNTGPTGGMGTGVNQTITIYGRIPPLPGAVPAADTYTDTVIVTLNW